MKSKMIKILKVILCILLMIVLVKHPGIIIPVILIIVSIYKIKKISKDGTKENIKKESQNDIMKEQLTEIKRQNELLEKIVTKKET